MKRRLDFAGRRAGASSGPTDRRSLYDSWLRHYHDELLEALDARCQHDSEPDYGWFRELSDDLWAILLTKQYSLYPSLRAALPDLPNPDLQRRFNGRSGVELATSSLGFYGRLKDLYARHGAKPLDESRVLDFGCGWGRLTRYLARDVASGNLFGCDPDPAILAVCEQTRVPARLARSEEVPSSLPFRERFDLIYAFSVFTHLSEEAHEKCLRAIHRGLEQSGVLVLTARPPAYITDGLALDGLDEAVGDLESDEQRYAFAPHVGQPLKVGTFGEAVINLPYMRGRWSELFSLRDVSLQLDDMYQVIITLQHRGAPEPLASELGQASDTR